MATRFYFSSTAPAAVNPPISATDWLHINPLRRALTSVNSGGPDLNFPKDKPYSTPLKGFADIDVKARNFGAFARVKAWYDYELEDHTHPYGNYPNRFAQNERLSDDGFASEARFKNAMLTRCRSVS